MTRQPATAGPKLDLYFSDYFSVTKKQLKTYGAFNVSLVSDLPLFIDPFLLFNSKKSKYRGLHDEIIRYLRFLRDKAVKGNLPDALIRSWYKFPEIRQNWLGFSRSGNHGSGLGTDFANALSRNLNALFSDFGQERVTKGSHIEKLCLITDGVGRDKISDFATNLLHGHLLEFTQRFAQRFLDPALTLTFSAERARFNYKTEFWEPGRFTLPNFKGEYVLLTPLDLLTRDDTWINRSDLLDNFEEVPVAIPDDILRAQVSNYFEKMLPDQPKKKDRVNAARWTIEQFPQTIDYYIKLKEQRGDIAETISQQKVDSSDRLYVQQFGDFAIRLEHETGFYRAPGNTYDEAIQRANYLKDFIENKGGHRFFYVKGEPIAREEDIQLLYRLVWFATPSDVTREANDGRGPVDFKISRGAKDKTLVEFKLASNSHLERNLEKQLPIYQKASDAKRALKVIIYFSAQEKERLDKILKKLGLTNNRSVVLIDARKDNKPSGSVA